MSIKQEAVRSMRGGLVVSCQALPDEPLHSSFIMGRMARAAEQGGASGIRANTAADIAEIRRNTSLPIIGIVKRDCPDSAVYITPGMPEVDELVGVGVEVIALDATGAARPGGVSLDAFYAQIRAKYPDVLLMADCSTVGEALHADALGFDFIGTTMVGYTPQSRNDRIERDDFAILREIIARASHPVIAEGNISTPDAARRVLELGSYCVVVGSAITRPQLITASFTRAIRERTAP